MKRELTKLFIFGAIFLLSLALGWNGWQQYTHVSVVVEWSTASELDTVGFNLYRGTATEGESEKINPTLIPPSEDPLVGGDYRFEDDHVVDGQKYYYWLEDVNTSGTSSRHGPIEVEAQRGSGSLMQFISAMLLAIISGLWLIREYSSHKKGNFTEHEIGAGG